MNRTLPLGNHPPCSKTVNQRNEWYSTSLGLFSKKKTVKKTESFQLSWENVFCRFLKILFFREFLIFLFFGFLYIPYGKDAMWKKTSMSSLCGTSQNFQKFTKNQHFQKSAKYVLSGKLKAFRFFLQFSFLRKVAIWCHITHFVDSLYLSMAGGPPLSVLFI